MKYIKILSIVLIINSLFSCQNEELVISAQESTKALTVNDYFKVLTMKPKGGRIKLESNAYVDTQHKYRKNVIVASDYERNIIKDYKISDKNTRNNFQLKNSKQLGNVFGKTINYSIGDLSQKNNADNDVYIPELLEVNIDVNNISEGTVIQWNVDSLNENGLIIWYEYSPSLQDKASVLNTTGLRFIRGAVTIPDTIGSYTITADDIANVPNDARISLHVTRAGFDISQSDNDGNQVILIGATTVSKDLRVAK